MMRPGRPDKDPCTVIVGDGPSQFRQSCEIGKGSRVRAEQITAWLDQGLTLMSVHRLLRRRGAMVPYRVLRRYATDETDFSGNRQSVLPVPACEPGAWMQVVLGRLGMLIDESDGRRRVVHGLIFTAVYSRHLFVHPMYRQTLRELITGFEAAWSFFGGVFRVVTPSNIKAIVDTAYATNPKLNEAFRDYAQMRGITVDFTAMRRLDDIPPAEHNVSYVRSDFFANAHFQDITDCRRRAERWCAEVAGTRVHPTTGCCPAEAFAMDEQPRLSPAPEESFEFPTWTHPRVGPDAHVRVAKAFYSVPGDLVGRQLDARADARTVKLYWRGELVRVHGVVGRECRSTDPADRPVRRRQMQCAN